MEKGLRFSGCSIAERPLAVSCVPYPCLDMRLGPSLFFLAMGFGLFSHSEISLVLQRVQGNLENSKVGSDRQGFNKKVQRYELRLIPHTHLTSCTPRSGSPNCAITN